MRLAVWIGCAPAFGGPAFAPIDRDEDAGMTFQELHWQSTSKTRSKSSKHLTLQGLQAKELGPVLIGTVILLPRNRCGIRTSSSVCWRANRVPIAFLWSGTRGVP